jgi:hypothetical protein
MENVALGIALVAWLALTVWLYDCRLKAEEEICRLNSKVDSEQRERVALSRENNRLHALAYPAMPPISPARVHPTDEQNREHKRRWHERQAVEKALKWDEAAKGPQ